MNKTFTYENISINQWLKVSNETNTSELVSRCTADTVKTALAEFENVSLVSAEIEPAIEERGEVFHVVLLEKGFGTTPSTINVWCPLNWNHRFLACVGGGVRTLHLYDVLGKENRITMPFNALQNGFATANTDGGVPGETFYFGLDEATGKIDYDLILNLAHRSTHSMTVIAKAVITAVYGKAPDYCYLQGASGGGRQALAEAQLFPEDYDGYWAVDPAINWAGLFTAMLWPLAVMNEENHILTPPKLEVMRTQAILQSGGKYDFIETANTPSFNPYTCVGLEAKDGVITDKDAKIAKLIFDGAKTRDGHFLWYGFRPGTHFWSSGLLGEPGGCYYKEEDCTYKPVMNALASNFFNSWLKRDMNYDWNNITYKEFEAAFYQCKREMGCMECNNPDLYNAIDVDVKILMTHAVADDTIPCDGTLDYYKKVVERFGDETKVNNNLRMFLTPGGGHTDLVQPGISLTLSEGMTALMQWVENGIAPTELCGLQYDFEQNAPILTGKTGLYQLNKDNTAYDVHPTAAYDTRNTDEAAPADSIFNANSTIKEIQAHPQGAEILKKHLGNLLDNPAMAAALGMSISKLKKFMPQQSIKAKIAACMDDLFSLKDEKATQSRYYGK